MHVALAREPVGRQVRRVALQARPGCLRSVTRRVCSWSKRAIGVPAPVAVVDRERVAREDALEPRDPDRASARRGRRRWRRARGPPYSGRGRQRGLEIAVVLVGPVLAPRPRDPSCASVTSTTRTKGWRASCLRSRILVRSARSRTVMPAIPANPKNDEQPASATLPVRVVRCQCHPPAPCPAPAWQCRQSSSWRDRHRRPPNATKSVVTAHAVDAHDLAIARGNLDGLREVLQRERHRMPESRARPWPATSAMPRSRQMALDAGRGVAVPALEPRVVLLVHDVAVHAGARIGGEIGEALGVDEGERAALRREWRAGRPARGQDEPGSRAAPQRI